MIVCRHERKGGGDVGESGRGSSAISGDVDVILQLRRPEGNQPQGRRVIETLSRYSETPEKVVIELGEQGFALLGDEEAVTLADALRKVSAHLRGVFEQKETTTLDELVNDLEMTRAAIQRALKELQHRGEVVRTGEGKRGSPYRSYQRSIWAERNRVAGMSSTTSRYQRQACHPPLDPDEAVEVRPGGAEPGGMGRTHRQRGTAAEAYPARGFSVHLPNRFSGAKMTNRPPPHLSAAATRLYASVVEDYRLEAHHLASLTKALEAWDRAEQARRLVEAEGIVIANRLGERKPHPAVAIERDSRSAFLAGMRQLALDYEVPGGSKRTAAAREARWAS